MPRSRRTQDSWPFAEKLPGSLKRSYTLSNSLLSPAAEVPPTSAALLQET